MLIFLRVGEFQFPCEVNKKTHLAEKKVVAVVWGILHNNSKIEENTRDFSCCVKNKLVLGGKYCNKPGKNKEWKSLITSLSMEMHAKGGEDWN